MISDITALLDSLIKLFYCLSIFNMLMTFDPNPTHNEFITTDLKSLK